MNGIRYTLIGDGPSDRMLLPLLTWLLRQHFPDVPVNPEWADFSRLRRKPRSLRERILEAIKLYPCNLLFVHCDAENADPGAREAEISHAETEARAEPEFSVPGSFPLQVCVIPIRMTEAWFLFDEAAIRFAASNPNGHEALVLPRPQSVESNPDPKSVLHSLLVEASGLNGRKRKKFSPDQAKYRLAERIEDFSSLDVLSAFRRLQQAVADLPAGFPQP